MPLALHAMAMIGRRYPFMSGNYRLVNHSRFSCLFPRSDAIEWCPSPGGEMLVPLDDEVGRCIYFTRDYDKKITWLCRKLLRYGDIAIDIGANLGVVSLAMSRFVGPTGRVHAFEPNPVLQKMIRSSLERNGIGHVDLHCVALGSEEGETELYVPQGNYGQGTISQSLRGPEIIRHPCKVRRLSDIAKKYNISKIQFIKMDVEGFENEVLLGSEYILQELRPPILFESNEMDRPRFNERLAVKTLRKSGYEFFSLPKSFLVPRVTLFDADRVADPGHDILAIHKDSVAAIAAALA